MSQDPLAYREVVRTPDPSDPGPHAPPRPSSSNPASPGPHPSVSRNIPGSFWRSFRSGGALTGFFSGIFGIGGEINAVALSAFNLEKAVYIATSGAISFMIDSARIANYIKGGIRLEPTIISGLLVLISTSLFGVMIGKRLVEKIPQEKFRNVVAVFIFLFGLKLLLFP
jgi:uncharacterized membrane protein YfcA